MNIVRARKGKPGGADIESSDRIACSLYLRFGADAAPQIHFYTAARALRIATMCAGGHCEQGAAPFIDGGSRRPESR